MRKIFLIIWMMVAALYGFAADSVKITWDDDHRGATIDNGLIKIHFAPNGNVNSVRYANQEMALGGKSGNIYLSYVTDSVQSGRLLADTAFILHQTDDMVEIVYANSRQPQGWLWQVGYIMRSGIRGYYTYATVQAANSNDGLHEARIVHRLNPRIFNYAWVSDDNQGPQPSTETLKGPVERIQDATFRLPDNTIYTKYDYCNYIKDDALHGMMGDEVGAWLITPSFEWVNGGVGKQELTVHGDNRSPLILQMFQSQHFGAGTAYFKKDQQKMYGPALVYFNKGTHEAMIADAKKLRDQELKAYPYQWMQHELFPLKRGRVKGRIVLTRPMSSRFQVVLAQPGSSFTQQGNDYQFWAETDAQGNFTIEHIRPGQYTLYAYALNGEATGFFQKDNISIKAGKNEVSSLTWIPEKYGTTLWQIGESDHRSAGFCLSDHRRQYGVFNEVPADLTYTIGKSQPAKDWYYAQTKNGKWDIIFNLDETYKKPLRLTIATAGAANNTRARVFVNGKRIGEVKTQNDSGIYRSAQQSGQPGLFTFDIKPELFVKGNNKITLNVYNIKHVGGIMYDCIKLEAKK